MAHQPNDAIPATPSLGAPTEPAFAVGTAAAAVGAVLAVLVAFGVNLTEAQTEAVLGVILVVEPPILAWITRGKVWSPASVARKVAAVKADTGPIL